MKESELYDLLKKLSIPVAYREFDDDTKPPFAVYYRTGNDDTFADNITYHSDKNIHLELHTPKVRNLALEEEIETLLSSNEIPYSVSDEIPIPEEKTVEIIYYFYI